MQFQYDTRGDHLRIQNLLESPHLALGVGGVKQIQSSDYAWTPARTATPAFTGDTSTQTPTPYRHCHCHPTPAGSDRAWHRTPWHDSARLSSAVPRSQFYARHFAAASI